MTRVLAARRARLRDRSAQGAERVRTSAWSLLQAAVGAAAALLLAQRLLGHPHPFFAAVAAFVCLGLSDERRLRRVAELALGVTLGVALGEAFVLLFGSGPVQVAVALAAAVSVALALVGGQLAPAQAGVQAVLVVALPPAAGSPFSRWQDAVVGSVMAVAVAVLLPGDPRRLPRERLVSALVELTAVLRMTASSVRRGDPVEAAACLERARATQPLVDAAQAALRGSLEVVRVSPLRRRHRGEVERLAAAAQDVDRALRNARVVARRTLSTVEGDHRMPAVADLLTRLAAGTALLRSDLAGEGAAWHARDALSEAARDLDPAAYADDRKAAVLVDLLRPLAVDLLEATGLGHDEARRVLPAA